jgi:hypothetical protein
MVFDPSDPVDDESLFELKDWTSSEFGHLQGKEEMPTNMPEPPGLGFTMRVKVDVDHAGNTVTWRSRTRFLVYLNYLPIYWSSKKHTTSVESSSFGYGFVAMKQCCEGVSTRTVLQALNDGHPVGGTSVYPHYTILLLENNKCQLKFLATCYQVLNLHRKSRP